MKKLLSIFVFVIAVAFNYSPSQAINNNVAINTIVVGEECVSDEEVLLYIRKKGYTAPVIVEYINCDRIVETTEALLYVKVAGGRITGVEEIRN